MASIKISDLRPSGFDSFVNSKSFLNDLSDSDLATIKGGSVPRVKKVTLTVEFS
jgi:hypothetical protein